MAFLDKTGLQNLTNKLVQGDAIKVASSKGTTVKEVIDNIQRECESVTLPNNMILENRVNNFIAGQGRDIDVSRDVEEGLSQIQLQGQTYQNLCKSYIRLEAQYKTNYNVENYKDKIIVTRINQDNIGWFYFYNDTLKAHMLKPNTKYTLFFKYESNFNINSQIQFMRGDTSQMLSNAYAVTKIKDNIYGCTISTFTSFENKTIGLQGLYFRNMALNKTGDKITVYKDMILLEGDYTQIPINEIPQYFEGIKSSFEDKVVNINIQGKNFFDVSKLTAFKVNNVNIFWSGDKLLLNGAINGTWTSFATSNALPKGTYSLRVYNKGVYWGGKAKIWGYNSEGKLIANVGNGTTFTIEEDVFNIKLVIEGFQSGTMIDAELTIQIERAVKFTPYEPYYNCNYKFDIREPLKRLPNGVCDEIRNNNGKWELVRRCHEVKISSEILKNKINIWGESIDGFVQFYRYLKDTKINHLPAIDCNGKTINNIVPYNDGAYKKQYESFGFGGNNFDDSRYLSFSIATTRIKGLVTPITDNQNVQTILSFLDQNDVKIIYELETPIISPIDPINFNVSQGTTININSDIAPMSTHEVILNRSGQIEQSIELIADLRSRIDNLEKAYDSNLIAAQDRLNNLKLNYELERKED